MELIGPWLLERWLFVSFSKSTTTYVVDIHLLKYNAYNC